MSTVSSNNRATIPATYKYDRALSSTNKIKVREPATFSGNRNKVNEWIVQLKNFFTFKDINEQMKSTFAASLMVGPALKWIEPHLNEYVRGPRNMGQDGDGNFLPDREFERKFH